MKNHWYPLVTAAKWGTRKRTQPEIRVATTLPPLLCHTKNVGGVYPIRVLTTEVRKGMCTSTEFFVY